MCSECCGDPERQGIRGGGQDQERARAHHQVGERQRNIITYSSARIKLVSLFLTIADETYEMEFSFRKELLLKHFKIQNMFAERGMLQLSKKGGKFVKNPKIWKENSIAHETFFKLSFKKDDIFARN